MATRSLGDMIVRIVGENKEFDSAISKSEKNLENFGKTASKIGGNLTKFITLPLVGIGVAAVKSASDMESAQIAFETLLGSGEKAKVLLGQLKQFASTTPFEFQDIAQGAKTLLSFGVAAESILPITKQLGDIALGDSEKFKSLSVVFGQISSTGRLMGQDLLQLINVGFNPLQEISKVTGETMAELKKRMEEGGISAEEVAKAFTSATSEGGRFFQGTEKLGKSFAGQLSTLKDDAMELARGFGEILLPTLRDIMKVVSGVIQEFNKLDPETKKTIVNIALAAAAAGPLIGTLGKLAQAIGTVKTAISALASFNPAFLWLTAIGAAVGLVAGLIDSLNKVNEEADEAAISQYSLAKGVKAGATEFERSSTILEEAKSRLEAYNRSITRAQADIAAGRNVNAQNENLLKYQSAVYNLTGFIESYTRKVAEQKKAQEALNPVTATTTAIVTNTGEAIRKVNEQTLKANTGFKNISDNMHAHYIQQQMDIEETQRINQEATLEANSGFKQQSDDIAAGYQARNIEAKMAFDKLNVLREEDGKKQFDKTVKDLAAFSSGYQIALNVATSFFDALANLYAQDSANSIAALTEQHGTQISLLNSQLQAELDAAGVADLTAVELAEKKLATAKAKNDAEAILEAENALKKAQIEQKFADKVTKINEKFEKDKAEQQYKGELAAWEFKLLAALAAAPVAIINAINTGFGAGYPAGLVLGPALGIAAGVSTAIQLAAIGAAKPKPPKLAAGGIVMPRAGGVNAIVAEAGQPEAVIPLDRMNEFIDNRGFGGGSSQSSESFPVSLTIKLSERQLYKGIFQATKNRDILIDASAVVNQ